MVASESLKRWISSGYADERPCTFATYLHFIANEQHYWTPGVGWLIPSQVEGSTKMWNDIGSCLQKVPNPKREAEIITMIEEGPGRQLKEMKEALEWEHKGYSKHNELAIVNVPQSEPAPRNLTENSTLETVLTRDGPTIDDTGNTEMADAHHTTNNTNESQSMELLYSQFHPYRFFLPLVEFDLPFFQFIVSLPSVMDKYICANTRNYPGIATLAPIVYIATFDDLQVHENSPFRSGYSLAHDVLTDDILIRVVTWYEPPSAPATTSTHRSFPPLMPASWSRENRLPLLFRGSPAQLARLVLGGRSLAKPRVLARGFSLLLKLVASEWMLLNADALKAVRWPEEHEGTFTDELQYRLHRYVEGILRPMLQELPFPNIWSRDMLGLPAYHHPPA